MLEEMEVVVAGVPISLLRKNPSACQCSDCRNGSKEVSQMKLGEVCERRSKRFLGGLGNGISVSAVSSAIALTTNSKVQTLSTETTPRHSCPDTEVIVDMQHAVL